MIAYDISVFFSRCRAGLLPFLVLRSEGVENRLAFETMSVG